MAALLDLKLETCYLPAGILVLGKVLLATSFHYGASFWTSFISGCTSGGGCTQSLYSSSGIV
jgi:hypothetical protein